MGIPVQELLNFINSYPDDTPPTENKTDVTDGEKVETNS